MTSRASFAGDLLGHLNVVQGHYGKLFEGDPAGTAKLPAADYSAGPRRSASARSSGRARLQEAGDGGGHRAAMDGRRISRAPAEATRNAFVEFVPALIDGLAHAEEPDSAVAAFDRFLQALQRGGRLISLLSQNRDLVALVALILGARPALGDMLARQPQIMDGLIDPRFFGAMPDQQRIVRAAGGDAGGREFLRGISRSPAAVRPGKPVPDRHAHPVRHGVRPAGGRRLCRCRRGHRRIPCTAW